MINTILAKKLGMTQTFEGNKRTPVTILEAGPCVVTYVKNNDIHGYTSVQLGFKEMKLKNTTKPMQGHLKGALTEKEAPRFLREVRTSEDESLKEGDTVKASQIFAAGDTIQVTGISKGKGFAGGIKRYGFRGGPKTHGQSDRHRAPGSIGQGTTPGRVYKGKRMAGHKGVEQVTIKNLKVISVKADTNELWVNGPVPGTRGTLIMIKRISPFNVQEEVKVEETTQNETVNTETKE